MPWRQAVVLSFALLTPLPAETLTLPRDQRPAWVSQQGIVMAGSWESLLIRQRIFGNGTYQSSAQQRADYLREHSPQMIARLKDLGVNFVMIHGYRGAGLEAERESMADAALFARRYRDAGLRVGVYTSSGTFFWDRLFRDLPQAKEWLVLDPQGKPIPYGSQTFRYYFDRNHPEVQAIQKTALRFAVQEIGADLVHFDNYSVGPGHDPHSAARFREYLRRTFTPEDMRRMKLAAWDDARPPREGDPELLRRAWQDFCCRSLAESYHQLSRYARSLRKDILVECNPGGIASRIVPPIDHGRLLQGGEAFWDEGGRPGYDAGRVRSRIRTYKVGRSMDNIAFAYVGTPLEMAESMAFNLDCLGCVCWYEYGKIVDRPYSTRQMSPEVAPFIRFFHRRRELLRDAEVVADVAVLRSFPSQVFGDPKLARLTHELEQVLIESRCPFQIIYEHQLAGLKPYRALALAGCPALSDRHVEEIRRYVAAGGRLCVVGPAATHNEWLVPRTRPALDDLPPDRVVRVAEDGDWLGAVRQACGGELSLSAAAKAPRPPRPSSAAAVGNRVYSDRDYVISKMPAELAGLPTMPLSAERTKSDSSLRFRALGPVRVFIAFAPAGFSPQWLDPPPQWKLYRAGALDTTIVQVGRGMDVYCRDFDAGKVRLFEGKKGTYVLLAVQATSPDFKGPPLVWQSPEEVCDGLCAELTAQPGRWLAHLVNYRSDGPIADVKLTLRVPKGQLVKSVTLASPQRDQDLKLPFEEQSGRVVFTVPKLDVYEIAVVMLK